MAGEDSGYDFFIAHRGDDTDEAKRLHRFLARNHRVFLGLGHAAPWSPLAQGAAGGPA